MRREATAIGSEWSPAGLGIGSTLRLGAACTAAASTAAVAAVHAAVAVGCSGRCPDASRSNVWEPEAAAAVTLCRPRVQQRSCAAAADFDSSPGASRFNALQRARTEDEAPRFPAVSSGSDSSGPRLSGVLAVAATVQAPASCLRRSELPRTPYRLSNRASAAEAKASFGCRPPLGLATDCAAAPEVSDSAAAAAGLLREEPEITEWPDATPLASAATEHWSESFTEAHLNLSDSLSGPKFSIFPPIYWLPRTFPSLIELCERIAQKHRQHALTVQQHMQSSKSSSKSPVSAFPASDILAAYNESRDRQLADNKVSTCVADTARSLESSARQQYETFSSNGQVPVGIHYRHRDKAEKGERLGQSYCENMMPGVENSVPPTVRLKNQFRPNGLRSSAPVSASQDGVTSYSVPSKQQQQLQQPQQATPLMVSGISRQHIGRERDDDDYSSAASERQIADGGDSGQLWQPVTAAGAASAQASPANGGNAAGPASGNTPRRPLNKAASTSWRSPSHGGSFSGSSGRASKKEVEPTYADPLAGAPASIQSRLAELAALESETVRWEKARKLKKKAKDRDD